MITAQQIMQWADKLRDLSAFGLRFAESSYDKERYQNLQDIALSMTAAATSNSEAMLEPLRVEVLAHPTPFSGSDAAIIDEKGRILLIQRSDNHKWAMPGGALEVGETPAQGAVREAFEETGVVCEPVALAGVFDSRLCHSNTAFQLYHFVFLCKPLGSPSLETASHVHETLAVAWFHEQELPEDLDPGHAFRIPEIYNVWRGSSPSYFDKDKT